MWVGEAPRDEEDVETVEVEEGILDKEDELGRGESYAANKGSQVGVMWTEVSCGNIGAEASVALKG